MSATFTTRVSGLRTATVAGLPDVIRQVDFIIVGTQDAQTFELPATTDLHEPDPGNFKQLADVTEADVAGWVDGAFVHLEGVRAHIQMVLDGMCARAVCEEKPLPWAPVPEADPGVPE